MPPAATPVPYTDALWCVFTGLDGRYKIAWVVPDQQPHKGMALPLTCQQKLLRREFVPYHYA